VTGPIGKVVKCLIPRSAPPRLAPYKPRSMVADFDVPKSVISQLYTQACRCCQQLAHLMITGSPSQLAAMEDQSPSRERKSGPP
jgi:hypothetical protein